ncbi:thymidylate kinase-like isoform X2 [Rhopilema esculentum]|eukprot:gene16913-8400_t
MRKRGLLIVFEGLDRSGKSTQARQLVEAFKQKGHVVKFMRFPERKTVIGGAIGDYLQKKNEMEDHAAHLLFSANRWEFMDEMKKDLLNGTTLVIDRYAFSGVAYTAAKGFSIEWCKGSDRGIIAPDIVFYLDLPLKEASGRGGYGEERYETKSFQEKVYEVYQKLKDDNWKIINADRKIDEIHDEILEFAMDLREIKADTALSSLWTENVEKISARKRSLEIDSQDEIPSKNCQK